MTRPVAVLTGDLVGSTRTTPDAVDRAFAVLSRVCTDAESWGPAPPRLTRFRGDGWQVVIDPPQHAVRFALLVRATFAVHRDLPQSRIAIGFGDMTRTGTHDLGDADGSAFHRSGRLLEAFPKRRRLACATQDARPGLAVVVALCDALADRWSTAQAEAMTEALIPDSRTQSDIGASLSLTQQAVQDRLNKAGSHAIEEALRFAEGRDDA